MSRKPTYEELEQRIKELERESIECKLAEEALKESEERYREFVEGTDDLITRVDKEGKFIFANHMSHKIFGLSPQDCVGMSAFDFVHPDDKEHTQKWFEDIIAIHKTSGTVENRQVSQNGEIHHMLWTSNFRYDSYSNLIGINGIARDITERKQTEEALRETESRYSVLFTGITYAVLVHHITEDGGPGQIIDANNVACKMLGYTRDELIGMGIGDIDAPESIVDIHRVVEDLKAGRDVLFEQVHVTKDGKRIPVEVHAQTFEYKGRLAILSTARDITERKQAEEALQQSEALMNATQQLTKVGGWEWDVEKQTMFWTDEVYRIHDFQPSEFTSGSTKHIERSIECYDPEDRPVILETFRNCAEKGQAYDLEFPFTTAMGRRIWIRTVAEPVLKGDKVVRIVGNIMDITDRKQAEETLLLHAAMMENLAEGVYLIGLDDFLIKWTNEMFEKMFGYNPGEIVGKQVDIVNALTEGTPTETRISIVDVLKETGKWHGEVRNIKRDGTPFWSSANVSLFDHPEYGKVIVSAHTDITERKQAEEALLASEEKYRSMMESMKDAAYICSPELRIEYMNPAMIDRVGRDATGEFCHQAIYGNDEKCSWCVLDQVQQGEHVDHEVANPKNNNYYSTSNSPIHHADGSISKLTIARDITRVKKIESQLQQSQKMEAVSTLSGGIAHQFNNALYAITGNIDLLEMDFPDDENVANYAKEMKGSTRRMTQLTAQLLAYARGGKYQTKTVLLNDFLKESLLTIKYSIDSTIHVDTDLPQDILNVKIDITQMQMVLSNVLSNASEAMEGEGSIRIVCRNKMITDKTVIDFPELKPGNYACLSITDDGKGMDEETRTRIFEPFFTTKFEGRGLGMAAAFGIVKNHNGWISVDSELGKGTIVKIYLPAVEAPVKKDAKPKPKTEWIKGEGTILVIDDEDPVINVSRAMLERMGYRVLEAKTGQEAIDVVKNFDGEIELAMLDILLPGIGGESIYPLLMKARPNLKVIVFTGYSIKGPAQNILNAGAEGFIQKPFSMSELSEKLKKILGGE